MNIRTLLTGCGVADGELILIQPPKKATSRESNDADDSSQLRLSESAMPRPRRINPTTDGKLRLRDEGGGMRDEEELIH
jgi:hypothetical protein